MYLSFAEVFREKKYSITVKSTETGTDYCNGVKCISLLPMSGWDSMRKCAKSWESIRKCAKSWESMRKCAKSWESMRKCTKGW